MNVTAVVDTSGAVVERYAYDPYGQVTILNGADGADPDVDGETVFEWDPDADGASDVDNRTLYAGYHFDTETGLYSVRHRYYHPTLGRWLGRDREGYAEGLCVYLYGIANPVRFLDPAGLNTFTSAFLDEVVKLSREALKMAREKGYTHAADNIEMYLDKKGGWQEMDSAWLIGSASVQSAVEVNLGRFEEKLIEEATKLEGSPKGTVRKVKDYNNRGYTPSFMEETELYIASATAAIQSTGIFTLTRGDGCVEIEGTVEHFWWDTYAFTSGKGLNVEDVKKLLLENKLPEGLAEAQVTNIDEIMKALEETGRAKAFGMYSYWHQTMTGCICDSFAGVHAWWQYEFKWGDQVSGRAPGEGFGPPVWGKVATEHVKKVGLEPYVP